MIDILQNVIIFGSIFALHMASYWFGRYVEIKNFKNFIDFATSKRGFEVSGLSKEEFETLKFFLKMVYEYTSRR